MEGKASSASEEESNLDFIEEVFEDALESIFAPSIDFLAEGLYKEFASQPKSPLLSEKEHKLRGQKEMKVLKEELRELLTFKSERKLMMQGVRVLPSYLKVHPEGLAMMKELEATCDSVQEIMERFLVEEGKEEETSFSDIMKEIMSKI